MGSGIYRGGQKVTPVDATGWYCEDPAAPRIAGPCYGTAYTVASFETHADGTPAITLLEYSKEFRFAKRDFRPVVDESRRTSVTFTCSLPTDEHVAAQEHYRKVLSGVEA